jgi:hypothetical protein
MPLKIHKYTYNGMMQPYWSWMRQEHSSPTNATIPMERSA